MFNCGSIELRTICDQKARSDRRRNGRAVEASREREEREKRRGGGGGRERRAHGGRNTPTRILKSGPTNAIKRANYPWGGWKGGGHPARTCTEHVFYLRALREHSKRTRVTASARIRAAHSNVRR